MEWGGQWTPWSHWTTVSRAQSVPGTPCHTRTEPRPKACHPGADGSQALSSVGTGNEGGAVQLLLTDEGTASRLSAVTQVAWGTGEPEPQWSDPRV